MKRLNIKNIVLILVILVLVHFATGLLVSPKLGGLVVEKINQYSRAKVHCERVTVWPLTFSLSLKNLKIFDPDNTAKKIIEIKEASVFLSPIGLLSKRLVFSKIKISGANINLEGEPDGTFNIQKLAQPKTPDRAIKPTETVESAIQKKDWFAKGYDLLRKKFSSDALKKEKAQRAQAKKVTKTTVSLPKGRRVHFKSKDSYLFGIARLIITGSSLNLKNQDGRSLQVEDARIDLGNAAFDPELGVRLGRAHIEGEIKNAGIAAGNLKFAYKSTLSNDERKVQFNFGLKEVNLDAVRFIYEDSLPVDIVRGTLDIASETTVDNGTINSLNKLSLGNHELKPKGLTGPSDLPVPMPLVCQALNTINPLRLDFTISGTVEKPEFKDFTQSLMNMVKPSLKNIGQTIKSEVANKGIAGVLEAVSGKNEDKEQGASSAAGKEKSSTGNAVNSLRSLFDNNKQDPNR
ncbi:MAG: AsmA family protein [Candidatus Omnitrophica bacterium]|nr:AsmA family protein [Candidatus Omnitrophota bacterium]